MTTMRERMLAVVQGTASDRVPFVQYRNCGGPDREIWEVIGRENMGILIWSRLHRLTHPNCEQEDEDFGKDGLRGRRTTIRTPVGSLTQEMLFDPVLNSGAKHSHYVKTIADYQVLLYYLRDTAVHENYEAYTKIVAELGEDGLPHTAVERTPYQQLWTQWVSIEDLALHLLDAPELMEEVISAMADVLRRIFVVACDAVRDPEVPVPYVNFGDNITAPMIGLDRFEKYCAPLYLELADMLAATGQDIPVFVHMDGDLKPLWAAIGRSGVRGLDSFSPPPDNDTSAAQAARMWPEMRLGLNFPSSVHLADAQTVYKTACGILEEAGHTGRLQIQISENPPPGAWRTSYPQIVKAINDFGTP